MVALTAVLPRAQRVTPPGAGHTAADNRGNQTLLPHSSATSSPENHAQLTGAKISRAWVRTLESRKR